MVKEHLRPGPMTQGEEGPTARAVYRYFRDVGDAAIDTIFLSFADYPAARGPLLEAADWLAYNTRISGMLSNWRKRAVQGGPPKLIDGHQLMKALGIAPGPAVGTLLEALREAHAGGEIADTDQAIALARQLLGSKSQRQKLEE